MEIDGNKFLLIVFIDKMEFGTGFGFLFFLGVFLVIIWLLIILEELFKILGFIILELIMVITLLIGMDWDWDWDGV